MVFSGESKAAGTTSQEELTGVFCGLFKALWDWLWRPSAAGLSGFHALSHLRA